MIVLVASIGALAAARPRWNDERVRIVGLLAFFAAVAVLALAVGWGRAGRAAATGRMPTRYVLLAAPGLCAAYFTLLLVGQGWMRRAGPAAPALFAERHHPFMLHWDEALMVSSMRMLRDARVGPFASLADEQRGGQSPESAAAPTSDHR